MLAYRPITGGQLPDLGLLGDWRKSSLIEGELEAVVFGYLNLDDICESVVQSNPDFWRPRQYSAAVKEALIEALFGNPGRYVTTRTIWHRGWATDLQGLLVVGGVMKVSTRALAVEKFIDPAWHTSEYARGALDRYMIQYLSCLSNPEFTTRDLRSADAILNERELTATHLAGLLARIDPEWASSPAAASLVGQYVADLSYREPTDPWDEHPYSERTANQEAIIRFNGLVALQVIDFELVRQPVMSLLGSDGVNESVVCQCIEKILAPHCDDEEVCEFLASVHAHTPSNKVRACIELVAGA